MHVEPMEIRALARRIREQGVAARADAEHLVGRCKGVGWTGLSGAAMVGRAIVQATALQAVADRHETAARALEVHAAAVGESLALIAEVERRVHAAMGVARHRVRSFLDGLLDAIDPVDEALAAFVPPPPGSPEWLRVRLPGVTLPEALR